MLRHIALSTASAFLGLCVIGLIVEASELVRLKLRG
jgi:hypothetical protein